MTINKPKEEFSQYYMYIEDGSFMISDEVPQKDEYIVAEFTREDY